MVNAEQEKVDRVAVLRGNWSPVFLAELRSYECPQCGWHVSAHGLSQYGLDCPGGQSPAASQGRLPKQLASRMERG